MTSQAFQLISLFVLLLYLVLMLFYWYHWTKSKTNKNLKHVKDVFITVVIVGRNESENLLNCIDSIFSNDYPVSLFEVIYIDDFSTDNSLKILKNINQENFRFFELKEFIGDIKINNYKKKAIEFAISKAKGDIILQTDADTLVGKKWLISHAGKYMKNEINFVAGPVLFKSDYSGLQQFQKYDFIATMGVTCAGINSGFHFMANGANMSYRKKVFVAGNNKFASGDDMFLVQNIAKKYPNSIGYLKNKDAVVFTSPEKTITDFIRQRLRWATKTKGYNSITMKFAVMLVFITNLMILINIIAIMFSNFNQLYFTLFLVLIKLVADVFFINSIAGFFDEKINFLSMIASLLRYPIYIVFIGLLSLFKSNYQWKSRKVK